MSEQDAETDSADPEDGTASVEDDGAGDAGEESLSDIATEPVGDVDSALRDIVGEGESSDDEESDEETEREADEETEREADENLIAKIEQADAETVAEAIYMLRDEVSRLEDEVEAERERADDLESRLKRKQADFQNYKKRQKERKEEEIARATEDLVGRLLDVRDNLVRALDQDEDADIRGGVESTLEQFDQELDKENVEPIDPEPGDELDPRNHEVLVTIAGDTPEGTIAEVHRPGYEMAGKILRPAQVAVSDGSNHDGDDESDGDEE
jgi:molecular chaperone GrpE